MARIIPFNPINALTDSRPVPIPKALETGLAVGVLIAGIGVVIYLVVSLPLALVLARAFESVEGFRQFQVFN